MKTITYLINSNNNIFIEVNNSEHLKIAARYSDTINEFIERNPHNDSPESWGYDGIAGWHYYEIACNSWLNAILTKFYNEGFIRAGFINGILEFEGINIKDELISKLKEKHNPHKILINEFKGIDKWDCLIFKKVQIL